MAMTQPCTTRGCTAGVPPELETERLCLLHFMQTLDDTCGDIRRETAPGTFSPERRIYLERYVSEQGERLARVAISGMRIPDEMKRRILTIFLSLINLRESMNRAAMPRPAGSRVAR